MDKEKYRDPVVAELETAYSDKLKDFNIAAARLDQEIRAWLGKEATDFVRREFGNNIEEAAQKNPEFSKKLEDMKTRSDELRLFYETMSGEIGDFAFRDNPARYGLNCYRNFLKNTIECFIYNFNTRDDI